MNRRERRKLEKDMGLTKHRQSMNLKDRLKNMSESIEVGRRRNSDMEKNRRAQENEAADKRASTQLSSLATTIMLRDGISWYEAIETAKRETSRILYINEEN